MELGVQHSRFERGRIRRSVRRLNLKATLQTTRFSWPIDDDNNVPAKRGSRCLSPAEMEYCLTPARDQCLQGPDIVHRPRVSRLPAQWKHRRSSCAQANGAALARSLCERGASNPVEIVLTLVCKSFSAAGRADGQVFVSAVGASNGP